MRNAGGRKSLPRTGRVRVNELEETTGEQDGIHSRQVA